MASLDHDRGLAASPRWREKIDGEKGGFPESGRYLRFSLGPFPETGLVDLSTARTWLAMASGEL